MIFKEEKRDLFTVPQGYYLVHCISGDYTLGAGIAKQFVEIYNMRFKLHKNFPLPDGERSAHVGEALLIDNVFNLVTKDIYYHKPTYESLFDTLVSMRDQCEELDINKLAMPRIGCGLDKLQWDGGVRDMIEDVFGDSDIEILVCTL